MTKTRRKQSGGRLAALLFLGVLCAWLEQAGAQEKSFLWKVQTEKSHFYILGSIHLLKKEHYPLKKVIEDAFDRVKTLVLEIAIDEAQPERAQMAAMEKGRYRDGTTLRQNIGKETYTLAERRARDLGIEIQALSAFKPWVVALTLTSLQLHQRGFDPSHGVDRYLAGRAQQSGKTIAGLESLEFQIGLLDQLSKRDQESLLLQSLKEATALEGNVNEIVQSWWKGDVVGLEKLLLRGMREFPEVHRKVFEERNRRWLRQMETLIAEGRDTMVVVGAGHLVGKDGLLELLRQRGYTMEQL